jgi:hypothetical protein
MKKSISVALAILLIVNMVLLALGKINVLLFWAIIIVGALFAYWILPRIK